MSLTCTVFLGKQGARHVEVVEKLSAELSRVQAEVDGARAEGRDAIEKLYEQVGEYKQQAYELVEQLEAERAAGESAAMARSQVQSGFQDVMKGRKKILVWLQLLPQCTPQCLSAHVCCACSFTFYLLLVIATSQAILATS